MKENAIKVLLRVYSNNSYIQSVYMWGSILTDEFRPDKSDIDVIAIVDENTLITNNDTLNKSLASEFPNMKINFLYPSELNGATSKGKLTKFIPAECILYDMPSWLLIAGKKFQKTDFVLGHKTIDDIIVGSLNSIKSRFIPKVQDGDQVYFVKAVARLCYFIHQKNHSEMTFRYKDLAIYADYITKDACTSIIKIIDSGWDKKVIDTNTAFFQEFVTQL